MVRVLVPSLLILFAFVPPERPDVSRRGEILVMRMPEELLADREIEKQLATALTTTFLVEIRTAKISRGVAEIRIRYDLWDEDYVVSRTDFAGRRTRDRLSSVDALATWWSEAIELPRSISTGDIVEIELVILPFSLEDEDDARAWLARSGGVSSDRTQRRGIIEALIGTTLRARPLARHDWKVRLVEERR